MSKIKANVQTVDVVFFRGDWHIQWPDGSVTVKTTPEEVVRDIKKVDAKRAKASPDITATLINWFNTPPDFKAPK